MQPVLAAHRREGRFAKDLLHIVVSVLGLLAAVILVLGYRLSAAGAHGARIH